jgi:hypothetical protein
MQPSVYGSETVGAAIRNRRPYAPLSNVKVSWKLYFKRESREHVERTE